MAADKSSLVDRELFGETLPTYLTRFVAHAVTSLFASR
jgi:hypothetical protein